MQYKDSGYVIVTIDIAYEDWIKHGINISE